MLRYPKAEWLGNGQSGGSYTSGPRKVVLHTTETRTLPGYQGGATAPHLTYAPASRKWWQHTDLDVAARALRNEEGGEQTNRDTAWQVEIICYSARNIAEQVGGLWVGDLSGEALDDLREFVQWAGVDFVWPNKRAESYSEANAPGFRMSASEWGSFGGVCGHQHVVENTDAEKNTLKYLHAAFDGAIGLTREQVIDKLVEDARSDIIVRAELLVALAGIDKGATVDEVVNELITRLTNG